MRQEFVRGKRRYILSLDVDLFDACVINRHWYGETNRRHGRRQELFTDLDLAKVRFHRSTGIPFEKGLRVSTDSCFE